MKILTSCKKELLLIFIAIFTLSFTSLFSQNITSTIKGKVTDQTTGEPLAFANVVLLKKDTQVTGTQTDFDGRYTITSIVPGTYTVKVTFVGYPPNITKHVIMRSSKITFLDIQLKQSVNLNTFEIVEYEVPLISKDQTSSGATIRKLPGRSSRYLKRKHKSSSNYGAYDKENINTETYSHISENTFKNVSSNPLSTLSIDVDAAAYSNVRRFITNGQMPPADAVRIEEMINYFNYDYPQPKDEHPFSITTEISDCPWNTQHKLVNIGIQGEKIQTADLPPSNLVFLIDVSGSMGSSNKLPLLKKSLKLLVQNLTQKDRVAIVVYAGAAGVVLKSTPGNEKEKILNALNKLNAGGSTAGGEGIQLAYKIALKNFKEGGNNRVILATDGDFNVGASSDNAMMRLIEKKKESGVFLTCLGYGMGNYKDSKMEILADKGNGNYAYIDNILEAKKVLVNEIGSTLHTIAKDVKIQIEFNPKKISSYKLIGYENRLLNAEDFNDDTKDAGELGTGHTVTALYEVVLKGSEENNASVDPLRYQTHTITTNTSEKSNEMLTVKFRYKAPEGKKSKLITQHLEDKVIPIAQSSTNFRFSAAVAEFGLLLRNSPYKGTASYSQVIDLAKNSKGKDDNGYRAEFIRLVEISQIQTSAFLEKK